MNIVATEGGGHFANTVEVGILWQGCRKFKVLILENQGIVSCIENDLLVWLADDLETEWIGGVLEVIVDVMGSWMDLWSLQAKCRVRDKKLFAILICNL